MDKMEKGVCILKLIQTQNVGSHAAFCEIFLRTKQLLYQKTTKAMPAVKKKKVGQSFWPQCKVQTEIVSLTYLPTNNQIDLPKVHFS